MKLSVACLAASVLLAAAPSMAQVVAPPDPDPLPPPLHAPNGRWAAKGWADRIVLSPAADAARGAAVAWRTDARQTAAEAQIAEEIDGPLLGFAARTVAGTTAPIENENGRAFYHQARFDGLKPDTRYVYRVRAADGWSEWLPFRTAKAEFAPFRFIYLGDTQNDILEIGSRVIRSAFKEAGPAALVVHAGDLVAQREVKVHDDEWGEWTEAGGRAFAMTPQLPATGNHEYVDHILPGGEELLPQMDELSRLGIDYDVIPGVSSFLATAAALKKEYTLPGVSQTVILTRMEGRTPMPPKEKLRDLAKHNSTMIIFLSVGMIEQLADTLKEEYREDTPVAVVYKASWEDQKIVIGNLTNIAQKVKEAGITKTALTVVGDFLGDEYELSKLYDKTFTHEFRQAKE